MKVSHVAALLAALSVVSYAQEFRGTISGAVADPSGGMVAGAKVTATETRTNTRTQTTTDSSGEFVIPFLAPGTYDLTFEAPGFSQATRTGIALQANEHPVIDVRLTIGDVSQKVEITGAAA